LEYFLFIEEQRTSALCS